VNSKPLKTTKDPAENPFFTLIIWLII